MQPGLFPAFAGCSCRNAALLGSSGSAKPSSAPLRMPQAGIAGTDRELEAGLLPPSFHCPFPAFGEWHQVCLCAGPCCGASSTEEQDCGQAGSPGDAPRGSTHHPHLLFPFWQGYKGGVSRESPAQHSIARSQDGSAELGSGLWGTGLVPGTHHSHQPRLRGEDHPGRLGLWWVLLLISLLTDVLVAEVWSQVP